MALHCHQSNCKWEGQLGECWYVIPQASDLKNLLQQYEHWANRLFPKLTFKDVTDRIESLASKKEFKV